MAEFVHVETDQAVATIRLARPPMNALNAQVQDEIAAAAEQVAGDDDIRAAIIYGGEKVFAAGADIKEMADASYGRMAAGHQAAAGGVHGGSPDWQASGGRDHRLRPRRWP